MNKEQFARSVFDSINSNRDGFKNLVENWFEQNPTIEPVVVGLSDEQVEGFMIFWADSPSSDYIGLYKEWAKTQTFTQSRVFTDSEIQQKYQELYDDYQSLLVDNQQFQPNWDNDAPQEAEVLVLTSTWLNKSRQRVGEITSQKFDRPKPPAPTVEVGQVWMHNTKTGCDYIVTTIGNFKDSHDECVDSVTYHSKVSDRYYTRTRDDFLAKFERVQS
jgi:hypothetical protein